MSYLDKLNARLAVHAAKEADRAGRLWAQAYSELNAAVDPRDIPTGDTLVDNLIMYAEGYPDYKQLFKTPADAERAARAWLKHPPFKLGR